MLGPLTWPTALKMRDFLLANPGVLRADIHIDEVSVDTVKSTLRALTSLHAVKCEQLGRSPGHYFWVYEGDIEGLRSPNRRAWSNKNDLIPVAPTCKAWTFWAQYFGYPIKPPKVIPSRIIKG